MALICHHQAVLLQLCFLSLGFCHHLTCHYRATCCCSAHHPWGSKSELWPTITGAGGATAALYPAPRVESQGFDLPISRLCCWSSATDPRVLSCCYDPTSLGPICYWSVTAPWVLGHGYDLPLLRPRCCCYKTEPWGQSQVFDQPSIRSTLLYSGSGSQATAEPCHPRNPAATAFPFTPGPESLWWFPGTQTTVPWEVFMCLHLRNQCHCHWKCTCAPTTQVLW